MVTVFVRAVEARGLPPLAMQSSRLEIIEAAVGRGKRAFFRQIGNRLTRLECFT
jgi:hypothetical protein